MYEKLEKSDFNTKSITSIPFGEPIGMKVLGHTKTTGYAGSSLQEKMLESYNHIDQGPVGVECFVIVQFGISHACRLQILSRRHQTPKLLNFWTHSESESES